MLNRASRTRTLAALRADPHAGVTGLVMEHLAVSLNPRQGLLAGKRLANVLAASPGQDHTLARFHAELDRLPWGVYEIRRAILPKPAGNTGRAVRWLHAHAEGTHAQMNAELDRFAAAHRLPVTTTDGIRRAWLRHRGAHPPTAEWFYVAAPAGAEDKAGPGFAAAWPQALASPAQPELFANAIA